MFMHGPLTCSRVWLWPARNHQTPAASGHLGLTSCDAASHTVCITYTKWLATLSNMELGEVYVYLIFRSIEVPHIWAVAFMKNYHWLYAHYTLLNFPFPTYTTKYIWEAKSATITFVLLARWLLMKYSSILVCFGQAGRTSLNHSNLTADSWHHVLVSLKITILWM